MLQFLCTTDRVVHRQLQYLSFDQPHEMDGAGQVHVSSTSSGRTSLHLTLGDVMLI